MTTHNKAYKFRLYPTEQQAHLIRKTFGCVRFVYNKMLAERKEVYEKHKGNKEELRKQKFPTPAKYKEGFEWLKEVDSLALANAQLNLQTAYKISFVVKMTSQRSKVKRIENLIQRIGSTEILCC
ncbi:Helix-turn-helix domain-containing protein [Bacillus sp. 166amftsu]|nr:Helix-turn-helix domain-containing protein [Bacillus sp. 166amftsu]